MLLWLNTNEEDAMKKKEQENKGLETFTNLNGSRVKFLVQAKFCKPLISHDGDCIVDRNKHDDCCSLSVFYASARGCLFFLEARLFSSDRSSPFLLLTVGHHSPASTIAVAHSGRCRTCADRRCCRLPPPDERCCCSSSRSRRQSQTLKNKQTADVWSTSSSTNVVRRLQTFDLFKNKQHLR
ncbi:hypothetical protein L1887_41774 [Cichorium endivia]|nr:hypothetical protein L1887_41774 [Cichorium endivia]